MTADSLPEFIGHGEKTHSLTLFRVCPPGVTGHGEKTLPVTFPLNDGRIEMKRLLALALCAMMAFGLCACGDSAASGGGAAGDAGAAATGDASEAAEAAEAAGAAATLALIPATAAVASPAIPAPNSVGRG